MRYLITIFIIWQSIACTSQTKESMSDTHKKANHLIESTSPYLLQHAYNPVEWYPWGEEALARAKKEDKPILVSIGYSSCHWCHVMERESFENDSIAKVMNDNFICIKVDREERPDVDQIYMDAVQAMGANGGWPLNVFLTPDQKPFYGGTYFPPNNWTELLQNVANAFKNNREELNKSADKLTTALSTSELAKYNLLPTESDFPKDKLVDMYNTMAKRFDKKLGGFDRAPKFPMPGNWQLLLQNYHYTNNQGALDQVKLTLDAIAMGGIYDQAGGGFARYSVDAEWLAPHFEKMLYDNGQLVSLYSEAFKLTQSPLYKEVVYQTIAWLEREMTNEANGFYSALDADSEGVEGKFYVWTQVEIDKLLGENAALISDYYNVTKNGNWEHGNNILHKSMPDEEFATKYNLSLEQLQTTVKQADAILLKERTNRIRPGLDDKALAGWNGLMLKGLSDAYDAFGDKNFLQLAIKNAEFIKTKMTKGGRLNRSYKEGKATIDAYLEDYAFVIQGYLALYQSTFDEQWLNEAKVLLDYANTHFFDEKEKFYFFTNNSAEALIARKKEIFDNVIPASNSQMAINLYLIGTLLDNADYLKKSKDMLSAMITLAAQEPAYTYNWGILYGYMANDMAEIAIVGKDAETMRAKFASHYHPNKILMGTKTESSLPLMENKTSIGGKATIYVCYNKTCKLPSTDFDAAIKQLQ
jgi:uncharacterized protein